MSWSLLLASPRAEPLSNRLIIRPSPSLPPFLTLFFFSLCFSCYPFLPLCFNSHLLLICHHSVRIKNLNVIDTHFRNTQTHLQMLPETSTSSYDVYQNCYSLPISLSIFIYCIFLYFSPTFSSSSLCLTLLPFVSLTMSNTK